MEQIAMSLLVWIATHSPYQVANLESPPIVPVSPQAMTAVAYRDGEAGQGVPQVDRRLEGFFARDERPRGTIYVIRPEDTAHAAEYASSFRRARERRYAHFRCPVQGEFLVYGLGGKYLRQSGVADPLRDRALIGHFYSRCQARLASTGD